MATLTEYKSKYQHYFVDENGQKQGEFKAWYSNGQLRMHCFFVDDKPHGESKWWHKSGQLQMHCFLVHDKRHGEYKWCYSNGQLETHCFYVDGKRHGEYKSWYSDGKVWVHCYYQNGEVVVNFTKNPELYPPTDEAKTYFALKYGWTKWL
jgi:antitoxin component YwqK of YwqJK toxin-antitoxin module